MDRVVLVFFLVTAVLMFKSFGLELLLLAEELSIVTRLVEGVAFCGF